MKKLYIGLLLFGQLGLYAAENLLDLIDLDASHIPNQLLQPVELQPFGSPEKKSALSLLNIRRSVENSERVEDVKKPLNLAKRKLDFNKEDISDEAKRSCIVSALGEDQYIACGDCNGKFFKKRKAYSEHLMVAHGRMLFCRNKPLGLNDICLGQFKTYKDLLGHVSYWHLSGQNQHLCIPCAKIIENSYEINHQKGFMHKSKEKLMNESLGEKSK